MVLQILLIISVVLQLLAATVAIGLIRKTKYNSSWILFTVALCCMAFIRFGDYMQRSPLWELHLPEELFIWLGVITSLCFAVGVLLVQKIFDYIYKSEEKRRITERRILNTVLRTEEKERQRFSKDLHDGLGPLLSSAKMSVSALNTDGMSERNLEIIRNVNYVIDEAIRSVREVSINLSPHMLSDFGLARALTGFINRLPRSNMRVELRTNLKSERFDPDVEVILYRVICELITNSLKHSGATRVGIDLDYGSSELHIHYTDNGCGFDTRKIVGQGLGFSNIASRISTLKGGLSITGKPGEGMEARINVRL